jgi:hypothetical protein
MWACLELKMSAIASLFTGVVLSSSFEEEVIRHAQHGRVNHQLRELALSVDGLEISATKAEFIAFVAALGAAPKAGFAVARARAYWSAFALILSEMGETVPALPAWFEKKAAAPKAAAVAAVIPSVDTAAAAAVAAVIAAAAAGMLQQAEIEQLLQALQQAVPVTA